MAIQVTIELPEEVFSEMQRNPEVFAKETRIAAAVKGYELGMVSQSRAAELAGISRHDFLAALARYHVSPFQVTPEELEEEFARRFLRLHRNCLVARDAVQGVERVGDQDGSDAHWAVLLRGVPERLPVSRRQWPVVRQMLGL